MLRVTYWCEGGHGWLSYYWVLIYPSGERLKSQPYRSWEAADDGLDEWMGDHGVAMNDDGTLSPVESEAG